MKLLSLILVVLFVMGTYQQNEEFDQGLYNKLQKIGNTKFGKQLMDSISIQLQTGDAVNDLIKLLNDIEDQIQQEQDDDDEFIQKFQQECDDNLARLESEVEAANARVEELQAELDEKIPLKEKKEEQVVRKNDQKQLFQAEIVKLDERKELKDQEWAEEQQQHDEAAAAIQKAKQIIEGELRRKQSQQAQQQLQSGSFAQVSSSLNSAVKSSEYTDKPWVAFMGVLAEIAQDLDAQADQGAVQKVLELCEDILDKIAESREIERKDYQFWMEEYSNTRGQLEGHVDRLDNELLQLDIEITALKQRIQEAQFEKREQQKRAQDKQEQHDQKLKVCDDENVAYAERREQRHDELSVVSDTIGVLNANIRTFRKYIRERDN